jgi:glycosyltransferase involved in cell wall biosynthesis
MNKKILILSWSDLYGGAARSCYEIYRALIQGNKNIDLFVQRKISNDVKIKTYKKNSLNLILRKYLSLIFYKLRLSKNDYSYNLINSNILKFSEYHKYDIINLHWINSETLSLFDISRINKKVVLTLHDMWAFCGSEHYLYELPKQYFKNGKNIKLNFFDYGIWKIKKKFWRKKFQIVTPSKWLAKLVKKSHLMSGYPVKIIPYSVNKDVFKKKKINSLRIKNFNLKKINDKIDILFISAGKLFNYRKGFDILDRLASQNQDRYRIIIVGSFNQKDKKRIKSNHVLLDKINNVNIISKIYNFSDILALPSRLDNLPNVGLEAHSCGLPAVGFNVGGVPEIISHKKTGYIAKPFLEKDFIKGIEFTYKYRNKLGLNAEKKSQKWTPKKISQEYTKLFMKIKN